MSETEEILIVALDPLLRKVVAESIAPLGGGAAVTSISLTRATQERLSAAAIIVLAARNNDFDGLKTIFEPIRQAARPTLLVTAGCSGEGRIAAGQLKLSSTQHIAIPELDIRTELRAAAAQIEKAMAQAHKSVGRTIAPAKPAAPVAKRPVPSHSSSSPAPSMQDDGTPYLGTVICIGASTGGTDALLEVLSGLGRDCPPVAIVQHMPKDYVPDFAKRLDAACAINVCLAEDGQALRPGLAVLAPGDRQFRLRKGNKGIWTALGESERIGGHCPAVDVMMKSAAQELGKKCVGVILTGMGRDGADGLLAMRRAGARTAAQNEETCIVYGMPKVAIEEKAADTVLPLQKIASWISGITLNLPK